MGRKKDSLVRAINPADRHRKEMKAKEMKKNREKREQERTAVLTRKSEQALRSELEIVEKAEVDGRADGKMMQKRRLIRDILSKIEKERDGKMKLDEKKMVLTHEKLSEMYPDAEGSIYYHPITNPYGVPVPGMPQVWKEGYIPKMDRIRLPVDHPLHPNNCVAENTYNESIIDNSNHDPDELDESFEDLNSIPPPPEEPESEDEKPLPPPPIATDAIPSLEKKDVDNLNNNKNDDRDNPTDKRLIDDQCNNVEGQVDEKMNNQDTSLQGQREQLAQQPLSNMLPHSSRSKSMQPSTYTPPEFLHPPPFFFMGPPSPSTMVPMPPIQPYHMPWAGMPMPSSGPIMMTPPHYPLKSAISQTPTLLPPVSYVDPAIVQPYMIANQYDTTTGGQYGAIAPVYPGYHSSLPLSRQHHTQRPSQATATTLKVQTDINNRNHPTIHSTIPHNNPVIPLYTSAPFVPNPVDIAQPERPVLIPSSLLVKRNIVPQKHMAPRLSTSKASVQPQSTAKYGTGGGDGDGDDEYKKLIRELTPVATDSPTTITPSSRLHPS